MLPCCSWHSIFLRFNERKKHLNFRHISVYFAYKYYNLQLACFLCSTTRKYFIDSELLNEQPHLQFRPCRALNTIYEFHSQQTQTQIYTNTCKKTDTEGKNCKPYIECSFVDFFLFFNEHQKEAKDNDIRKQ